MDEQGATAQDAPVIGHPGDEAATGPAKPKKEPRPAWSYRAARKRAAREERRAVLKRETEVIDGSFDGPVELNRSLNWSRAKDYGYAREIGPSKEPVR